MSLYTDLMEKMQGKEYRGYFAAWCPFDEHKTPALWVNETGYGCMSCGARGTLKQLYKAVINGSYSPENRTQYVKVLPPFRKWMRDCDVEEIAFNAHRYLMRHPEYQTYLKRRKLMEFAKDGMFGLKDGWVTIPVKDRQGHIINMVCRGISSKKERYVLLQMTNEPILYSPNWDKVNESFKVYVPFGIFDAWAIHSLGLAVVTGTTGTSISADSLRELKKSFVIIPDKGEEAVGYRLTNQLGFRGDIHIMKYPQGTKDSDEIRRNFGKSALLRLLEV